MAIDTPGSNMSSPRGTRLGSSIWGGPFIVGLLISLLGCLVLSAVVGLMVLAWPGAGLAALTLMLAGYFFATGLFRTITSLMDRYPRWGWDCVDGIVSVALGVIIMTQWPISAVWAVGIVVGVELISRGIALMAGSLAVRSVVSEATHPRRRTGRGRVLQAEIENEKKAAREEQATKAKPEAKKQIDRHIAEIRQEFGEREKKLSHAWDVAQEALSP